MIGLYGILPYGSTALGLDAHRGLADSFAPVEAGRPPLPIAPLT
jgi:hypothetical protein